jgi:predicted enzyme related to lactoylglutathione lyase
MENPQSLLVVHDLAVSKNFYLNVLNLTLVEEHEDCIMLKSGQHTIILFQGGMASVDYAHGYNSNSTLLFTVKNLDNRIKQLKVHGVEFIHQTPNQNRWGRYAAFKDPSNIVHELFELNQT